MKQWRLDDAIENVRKTFESTEEKFKTMKLKKKLLIESSNMQYKLMAEGIKNQREIAHKTQVQENKRFEAKIKKQIKEFKQNAITNDIQRKREVQQLYAAKCRVAVTQAEPTEAEQYKLQLGDNFMSNPKIKRISKNILYNKGVL